MTENIVFAAPEERAFIADSRKAKSKTSPRTVGPAIVWNVT
jgi:hypothetical protein